MTMTQSNIKCQPWQSLGNMELLLEKDNWQTTNFFIQNAINVSINSCNFSKCGVSQKGGVFTLKNTQLYDNSSLFTQNSAKQGGVIYCEGCQMFFNFTKFTNNYASLGGVITMLASSFMRAKTVTFQSNTALTSAGCIQAATQSYFELQNNKFSGNYALQNSAIEVLRGSNLNNISIVNTTFSSNTAVKNTISLMYANVQIRSSLFTNNQATQRSKNIFCGFSNIYILDSQFESPQFQGQQVSQIKESTSGTFLFVIFNVSLHIQNTIFLNGISREGGAIFIQGDTSMRIFSCTFQNNLASQSGGAIYAESFIDIIVGSKTKFQDNLSNELGDDIYVSNTPYNFSLSDSSIINPKAKNSIYAEMVNLKLLKMNIQNIQNDKSDKGAALQCLNCRQILINQTSFLNLKSIKGGAIYIEEQNKNKKDSDRINKYHIDKSSFLNSYSQIGGAIYADSPQYLTISNSSFIRGRATKLDNKIVDSGSGGAIYFTCDSPSSVQCSLKIINGTEFVDNEATIKGGAIYWDQIEPSIDNSTRFSENRAQYYGKNTACFAQVLSIITKEQYDRQMAQLKNLTEIRRLQEMTNKIQISSVINEQRSGGYLPPTYLAHIDKYGQIVGSDFGSSVKVTVSSSKNSEGVQDEKFSPLLEGSTQFYSYGGMIAAENISFTGKPGYTYKLQFSTDGIDITKQPNQIYLNQTKLETIQFNLDVKLRECDIGEEFTSTGKCQQCPEGSGFSVKKMTEPGKCEKCPSEKAICNGGSNIGPKPGYWRKNNETSNILACYYFYACLGMIPPENNPQGSCDQGYRGIICADCQVGYSRTGEFQCSQCPEYTINVVRIGFILFGAILAVIYMVRSTMSGAKNTNNVTGIYMKILLNHFQLVMLTASFNFQWPDLINQFFDSSKPVASTAVQIFSVDCFLENRKVDNDDQNQQYNVIQGIRIIFQRLLIFAVLPFILFFCCLIFWWAYKLIKRSKERVGNKFMSTLVIVLFLVHPNIIQVMFYNFKCIDIDGDDRLQSDLEIICYNPQHKLFSFGVALPSIVAWGLGIPLFAFIILFRVRKNLDRLEVKEKFGFLFRGFRKDYYYWEIIIMYRKIGIIFISIFVSSFGIIAQALFVFIVVIGFLILNSKKKPFNSMALNDLETLSLVTSMLSVYCGLYFIVEKPKDWIDQNPQYSTGALYLNEETRIAFFSIIVASNGFFFLYWIIMMGKDIFRKFRKGLPKVYFWLCLCGNKEKFDRIMKQQDIQELNELLREDYMRQIKFIKNLYTGGEYLLTAKKLQRLKLYLSREKVIKMLGDKRTKLEEKQEIYRDKRLERKQKTYKQHMIYIQRAKAKIFPQEFEKPEYKMTDFKFQQVDTNDKSTERKTQEDEKFELFSESRRHEEDSQHKDWILKVDENLVDAQGPIEEKNKSSGFFNLSLQFEQLESDHSESQDKRVSNLKGNSETLLIDQIFKPTNQFVPYGDKDLNQNLIKLKSKNSVAKSHTKYFIQDDNRTQQQTSSKNKKSQQKDHFTHEVEKAAENVKKQIYEEEKGIGVIKKPKLNKNKPKQTNNLIDQFPNLKRQTGNIKQSQSVLENIQNKKDLLAHHLNVSISQFDNLEIKEVEQVEEQVQEEQIEVKVEDSLSEISLRESSFGMKEAQNKLNESDSMMAQRSSFGKYY